MNSGQTLTDCYVPLAVPPTTSLSEGGSAPRSASDGLAESTRSDKSLRRLLLSTSVLSKSDGSALLELGHTKVICSVYGPRSAASSSLGGGGGLSFQSGGSINCEVRMAPSFGVRPQTAVAGAVASVDGRLGGRASRTSTAATLNEVELSAALGDAIAPSIRLDLLPKCVIDIFVMVLQADGSVLPAAITAASLALADAGVELFDLVASCGLVVSVEEDGISGYGGGSKNRGKRKPKLLADPTESEELRSEGGVTIALMPNWREVTLWEQTGRLPASVSAEAIELCQDGCETMFKFMRECLVAGESGNNSSCSDND